MRRVLVRGAKSNRDALALFRAFKLRGGAPLRAGASEDEEEGIVVYTDASQSFGIYVEAREEQIEDDDDEKRDDVSAVVFAVSIDDISGSIDALPLLTDDEHEIRRRYLNAVRCYGHKGFSMCVVVFSSIDERDESSSVLFGIDSDEEEEDDEDLGEFESNLGERGGRFTIKLRGRLDSILNRNVAVGGGAERDAARRSAENDDLMRRYEIAKHRLNLVTHQYAFLNKEDSRCRVFHATLTTSVKDGTPTTLGCAQLLKAIQWVAGACKSTNAEAWRSKSDSLLDVPELPSPSNF